MHIKALTATLAVAVFAGSFIGTAQAKALSQTTTTNSKSTAAVASDSTQPPQAAVGSVNVASGDSLSSIAAQHETTYIRLFDDNSQIQNPDLIYVGELINIPDGTQQLPDRYGEYQSALAASQASQAPTQSVATPPSEASESTETSQSNVTTTSSSVSAPAQPVALGSGVSVWTQIAKCESGGNWAINTGNGFYGGLQFTLSSWQAVGGTGLPSDASEAEQIALAQKLQAIEGWGAWPVCSAKLGL